MGRSSDRRLGLTSDPIEGCEQGDSHQRIFGELTREEVHSLLCTARAPYLPGRPTRGLPRSDDGDLSGKQGDTFAGKDNRDRACLTIRRRDTRTAGCPSGATDDNRPGLAGWCVVRSTNIFGCPRDAAEEVAQKEGVGWERCSKGFWGGPWRRRYERWEQGLEFPGRVCEQPALFGGRAGGHGGTGQRGGRGDAGAGESRSMRSGERGWRGRESGEAASDDRGVYP
mmetsp:Transcript_28047/g.78457  ORF Transcript_28047/g.78457 Transcript_28047/m.78457 type:complete len:226 (-) Transcript_28047:307-984(-)